MLRQLASSRCALGVVLGRSVLEPAPLLGLQGTPMQAESRRGLKRVGGHPRGTPHKPHRFWDFGHLNELTGGQYTHKPLRVNRLGGRDPNTGKMVNKIIGGGVKFDYFMLDLHRRGPKEAGKSYDERVIEVRRDPNRTPYIALVAGTEGKRWIYATKNMKAGQIIQTFGHIPERSIIGAEGNAHPIGALAEGTIVNSVELFPDDQDAHVVITEAGSSGEIVRHQDKFTIVRMPNKHEYALLNECMATIGQLSHEEWKEKIWGSPQMRRRFGWRPTSGPAHQKKSGYCGRKIRALPPARYLEERRAPPKPLQHFTLTKKQLSHNFGTAAAPKLVTEFNNLVRL